jgi:hypothetical protein
MDSSWLGCTITDTPHSVGLLWTSDQPVAEISICQHRKIHKTQPCSGRNSNPQSQIAGAADPRLRPPGHWDRLHKRVGLQHLHLHLYLYHAQASHCSKSAYVAVVALFLLQCMLTYIIGHEIWYVGC